VNLNSHLAQGEIQEVIVGAEYMGAMGGASFDHDVTRIVAGDAESLRARLADALERMGYRVLNENPIHARHGASVLARSGCSQDILDYHRSLYIGLKSAGANSTRITFAYTVKGVTSGFITKGDRNTLTREAESIVALAQSWAVLSYCPACGAGGVGGTRFCRQCGASVASADPPELDLLRLTADANASFKNILTGAIFVLIGVLAPALIFLRIMLFPIQSGGGSKTGEADGAVVGYCRRRRAGVSYRGVMATGQGDQIQARTGRTTRAVPPQLYRRSKPSGRRGAAAPINSTPGSTLGHGSHHRAVAAGSQADE
jgi:hypothetical protein